MDQPAQECTSGDDNRPGPHRPAITQANAGGAAVQDDELIHLALDDAEIGSLQYRCLHRGRIEFAIGLGAWAAHRRTLAAIEHAELDSGGIRDPRHEPIQRLDFPDQMALAQAPHRWLAE